jgi:hypothetical protein
MKFYPRKTSGVGRDILFRRTQGMVEILVIKEEA